MRPYEGCNRAAHIAAREQWSEDKLLVTKPKVVTLHISTSLH